MKRRACLHINVNEQDDLHRREAPPEDDSSQQVLPFCLEREPISHVLYVWTRLRAQN